MPKLKIKESAWLAIILVAAMYVVNYLFTAIKMAPTTLFTTFPTPVSPISSTVGTKIMQMLGGVIPITFDIPSLVIIWISAFVTLLIGTYAVDYMPSLILAGKTNWAKLTWTILWGAAVLYLVIVGFKMISFNQAIGLFIYTIPASIAIGYIGEALKLTAKY